MKPLQEWTETEMRYISRQPDKTDQRRRVTGQGCLYPRGNYSQERLGERTEGGERGVHKKDQLDQ